MDDDNTRFREKIDKVEEWIRELSDDFLRCSKSDLVNRNHIRSYSKNKVELSNGDTIAISRQYVKNFLESL